jgi:callose synthase
MNRTERFRRRADSNYFELDADRRRNKSERGERLSRRLNSLDVGVPGSSMGGHPSTGGAKLERMNGTEDDDEISVDFCCEFLQAKFGFQEGSVSNQREHVLLLLANGKAREKHSDAPDHHTRELHEKLISNYKEILGGRTCCFSRSNWWKLPSSITYGNYALLFNLG